MLLMIKSIVVILNKENNSGQVCRITLKHKRIALWLSFRFSELNPRLELGTPSLRANIAYIL